MAYELCEETDQNNVPHNYRHDLESFFWVLLWICANYSGGRRLDLNPFAELDSVSWKTIKMAKKEAILIQTPLG